ncbi:hypothetical protein QCA50_004539 [Cerrena zonata]|uniref:Cytochrome P450 n=1 Tax=Cerrena zonata TaxID=2478898 RepID=A0AAW0GHS9_9APHY
MENILAAGVIILLSLLLYQWLKRSWFRPLPLPPGPNGIPLIGNVFDIPKTMPWKAFRDLASVYGDVLFLRVPTQNIVVLNSTQAAFDLLEKRSDIYSSRISKIMIALIIPKQWNFALMEYTPEWRVYRRNFHQFFHQRTVHNYHPIQLNQCRGFLRRTLGDSSQLSQHIRLIFSGIILKIIYDIDITDMHDEYIQIAEEAIAALSIVQVPGKFWVEFLPIMRYIPRWVPGAYFKRKAEQYQSIVAKMKDQPFDAVKRNMALGKSGSSVAATMIENIHADAKDTAAQREQEEIARSVTGLAYGAAADTTTGAAQTFFIAMSLFPHVQRKAQEELDRVVGPNRLPDFDDYDNLVYIQAVALESMRWIPVTPIGVPHALTRDDEYRGFVIPKGTMIIANAWAMLRNPEDYPDPECFNPDRFIKDGRLNPEVRDPTTIAFGFGRRICPGRWLSSDSLFMTIASVLHTLNIHPILEPDGKKYDPFSHRVDGINLTIEKVPCTVTPRSEAAAALIRQCAA